MKHVERITFGGDDGKYGRRTGYCSDVCGYVVRGQSGWVYDYCLYYSVSESEHAEVDQLLAFLRCLKGGVPDNNISLDLPSMISAYILTKYTINVLVVKHL